MKSAATFLALILSAGCLAAETTGKAARQPNILVILADDLGFSDLGCYGSEIATPHLDRLAAGGLRFTQFYNTAKCHSSRVSLLSGRWCEQADSVRLTRAAIIPEILAPAGYSTLMTGKWHLDKQPTDFGFQRYFGHLSGATNYYRGDGTFRLNGQPWPVPKEGFYTTVANVDYALRFLDEARGTRKPWFLYLAFNAPHAPLQPLEADYKKYLGQYDVGWDAIRAARVAKQQHLGLFGRDVEAGPRPDHVPAWDSLAPEMRRWESRRMAAYAGLIDRVDQELGRLLASLQRAGEMENTMVIFLSDNGACPYDRRTEGRELEPFNPQVTWSDSTGWAWVRNSPFRYYKQNQFEGGIATPAIVHWPAGLKVRPGSFVNFPAHLVDVLPTLAEVAGAALPASWPGRELTPLSGISLAPILAGQVITHRPPIHLLFNRDRGLRDGDWKLVSFQDDPWELYNIAQDRTERHNVAREHPDIVGRMAKQWFETAEKDLRLPSRQRGPVADEAREPRRHGEWTEYASVEASTERHAAARKRNQGVRSQRVAANASTDGAPEASTVAKGRTSRAGPAAAGVRARVATRLAVENGQWVIQCEGNDSGLAFDRLPELPAGPYALEFRLLSRASGPGEIYWTTDAQTQLPKGGHQTFPVIHDGQWQAVALKIPEAKPLYALRFDPCSGPGEVRIKSLQLKDLSGKVLRSWP